MATKCKWFCAETRGAELGAATRVGQIGRCNANVRIVYLGRRPAEILRVSGLKLHRPFPTATFAHRISRRNALVRLFLTPTLGSFVAWVCAVDLFLIRALAIHGRGKMPNGFCCRIQL